MAAARDRRSVGTATVPGSGIGIGVGVGVGGAGAGTGDAISGTASGASPQRETPDWYRDAKFGIMIHWGLYSVPGWAPLDDEMIRLLAAGRTAPETPTDEAAVPESTGAARSDPLARHSYAEWYQNTYLLDGPTRAYHRRVYGDRPYRDFRTEFVAAVRGWDPEPWAELCAAAGARYVVPTSKHHDGYLLWPSAHPNPHLPSWQTGRDVLGELGAAVRDRGLRYGLCYSGGLDWTFGNLPIRRMADVPASVPDSAGYARYVDAHWRELIGRYRPSVLWNDIGYPPAGDPDRLAAEYYAAVPDGVVNDRFSRDRADVRTRSTGSARRSIRRRGRPSGPWGSRSAGTGRGPSSGYPGCRCRPGPGSGPSAGRRRSPGSARARTARC